MTGEADEGNGKMEDAESSSGVLAFGSTVEDHGNDGNQGKMWIYMYHYALVQTWVEYAHRLVDELKGTV